MLCCLAMAEEDLNREPREPLQLRICMSDEWRDRLIVERISQHTAYCANVQCGDQICRYFSWFPQHYNQCKKQDCRSCPKYRRWMTCHSRNCSYYSECLLVHCPQFKRQDSEQQLSFNIDPENSGNGFSEDRVQIAIHHTTDEEDSKMTPFHPEPRRGTVEDSEGLTQEPSVEVSNNLVIPNKSSVRQDALSRNDDSRCLSQNSTDSDFGSSIECIDQTHLEEQLSLWEDMQQDAMDDSDSDFVELSPAAVDSMLTRIDTCLEQNKGKFTIFHNLGKLLLNTAPVQQQSSCPILPSGNMYNLDFEEWLSLEYGIEEQQDYKHTVAQLLPGDEVEEMLAHRKSIKQGHVCTDELRPIKAKQLGVQFIDPVEVIRCDTLGCDYCNSRHDVRLRIPEGAILPSEGIVYIEFGVTMYGPFKLSDGVSVRRVSPVVWLCVQQDGFSGFQKDVEITLPHFLHFSTEETFTNLRFLKADHQLDMINEDGEMKYLLKPADGKTLFEHVTHGTDDRASLDHALHGTLLTRHFCFICIATSVFPNEHTRYYLGGTIKTRLKTQDWQIIFFVCYFLKSCVLTVQRQLDKDSEEIYPTEFMFADGQELKIHIEAPGCQHAIESSNKITARQIDFQTMSKEDLQLRESTKLYPPRFVVKIRRSNSVGEPKAIFIFKGATEEIVKEILLSKDPPSASGSAYPKASYPTQQQPAYPTQQQPDYPTQQQPGYPPQQPGYPTQQQPGYPTQQQPGYPTQQQPGYPTQQQPGYPTQQQPGYPTQQQPGYPTQQQPGYPTQQPYPGQPTCTQLQPAVPDSRLPFYPHPPPAMLTRQMRQLEGSPAYSELPSTPQKTFTSPSQEGEPPGNLPPSADSPSTLKPTEKELMIELYNTVANNWRPIGIHLGISNAKLDIIAADHNGESQKCLMTMLIQWLHQTDPPPSWSAIAEAVEFTERPDIAQKIRQNYCVKPQPAELDAALHQTPQQHIAPIQQMQAQPLQQPPNYFKQELQQIEPSVQQQMSPGTERPHLSSALPMPTQLTQPAGSHTYPQQQNISPVQFAGTPHEGRTTSLAL